MSKLTISGIEKLGPYCPPFKRPLDARLLVTEYNHLTDLVSDYGAYPGMIVYVNSTDDKKGLYVYNGESWKPVATSASQGDIEIPEVDLTGYATESYVNEAINNIDIPEVDLSGYSKIDHTHAYKPTFSKSIYHGASGNPQQIKFITVDYSAYDSGYAAYFKLDATSCHGNGVSYQFLEEIIIGVTASGDVSLAINKSCQQSTGAVIDGTIRYYGDVFAVKDTTNKKVDFYILGGQWCNSSYSNLTPIGSATTDGVTQHTSFISYSSGERQWAQGCGNTCHDYLPISGGNLTGALTVNGAGGIDTNGYVTSTWLKTTDATDLNKAASKVAVIDASGWIYYRTPAELMSDMGAASKTDVDSLIEISSDGKTLIINI